MKAIRQVGSLIFVLGLFTAIFCGIPWYVMLTEGRYKYIRNLIEGEVEELYDLESDPEELINFALSPDQSGLLKKFRAATITELRRTKAGFVDRMPKVGSRF